MAEEVAVVAYHVVKCVDLEGVLPELDYLVVDVNEEAVTVPEWFGCYAWSLDIRVLLEVEFIKAFEAESDVCE